MRHKPPPEIEELDDTHELEFEHPFEMNMLMLEQCVTNEDLPLGI